MSTLTEFDNHYFAASDAMTGLNEIILQERKKLEEYRNGNPDPIRLANWEKSQKYKEDVLEQLAGSLSKMLQSFTAFQQRNKKSFQAAEDVNLTEAKPPKYRTNLEWSFWDPEAFRIWNIAQTEKDFNI